MGDVCYYCDGTGERDFLSGAPCHECNGTGWKEEEEDPRESMSLQELIEYEEQMDAMYADDGTITAAESDRQTESGDGMKGRKWDFIDGVSIEELDDTKLPQELHGLGIDNIDFTVHCTGYYEPASMYGGTDQIGWPAEGEETREIVSVRTWSNGVEIALTPDQANAASTFPDFRVIVDSADLECDEYDEE